ncbi:hypothetical protein L873DRAFT_79814 [Choiromyces venosus 120613-1]|uniref:Uncharacterized protein n=1 Tax=Choiromyces venosus 120613-1 TaxID=1336337 RepID=A0A3N4J4J9_9PEZI|nr:hypothetical protein L873DRAFT_79814 [Choiromyces venosus 120613-1]
MKRIQQGGEIERAKQVVIGKLSRNRIPRGNPTLLKMRNQHHSVREHLHASGGSDSDSDSDFHSNFEPVHTHSSQTPAPLSPARSQSCQPSIRYFLHWEHSHYHNHMLGCGRLPLPSRPSYPPAPSPKASRGISPGRCCGST